MSPGLIRPVALPAREVLVEKMVEAGVPIEHAFAIMDSGETLAFGSAVPWIAIGAYLVGGGDAPTFVYVIFVTLFVLFNSFAINMALQYRRVGPWARPLFPETAYIVLSLAAKSALAWQVFGSTLMG